MVTEFTSMRQLLRAIRDGKVPLEAASPGFHAARLGVTRHAVYRHCRSDYAHAWVADGVWLVHYPHDSAITPEVNDGRMVRWRSRAPAARRAA